MVAYMRDKFVEVLTLTMKCGTELKRTAVVKLIGGGVVLLSIMLRIGKYLCEKGGKILVSGDRFVMKLDNLHTGSDLRQSVHEQVPAGSAHINEHVEPAIPHQVEEHPHQPVLTDPFFEDKARGRFDP